MEEQSIEARSLKHTSRKIILIITLVNLKDIISTWWNGLSVILTVPVYVQSKASTYSAM